MLQKLTGIGGNQRDLARERNQKKLQEQQKKKNAPGGAEARKLKEESVAGLLDMG